ncbi:hypothetical protein L2E82_18454 [Cichorium intybus]|uniref:Uncharacterized protein n=1 Tax=Cichorium intybus TaxID=13427 RepID=A0ACB9F9I4_CICIN|nr:hypothetical protein L2E82_18454 [Cichorium intybus]
MFLILIALIPLVKIKNNNNKSKEHQIYSGKPQNREKTTLKEHYINVDIEKGLQTMYLSSSDSTTSCLPGFGPTTLCEDGLEQPSLGGADLAIDSELYDDVMTMKGPIVEGCGGSMMLLKDYLCTTKGLRMAS